MTISQIGIYGGRNSQDRGPDTSAHANVRKTRFNLFCSLVMRALHFTSAFVHAVHPFPFLGGNDNSG